MDLEYLKKILLPYLSKNDLIFDSMELVKEDGNLILRVFIDKAGGIDIDTLASCNEFISTTLDSMDEDMPEYFLEVSSPGAEKELKSLEEIKKHINDYIHVEIPNMIYEGHLLGVEDETILIRFNAKGRFKTIHIPYSDIKLIRLAVKI